jgi:hypothetical protein
MKKILFILTILTFPLSTLAVTVEISKNYTWDVLYVESDLNKKQNNLILDTFNDFNFKEVIRPVKSCDRIDYSKEINTCIRIKRNDTGISITYRNMTDIQESIIPSYDTIEIADKVYNFIYKTESPFIHDFIFSGQEIVDDSIQHSIFVTNMDGTKVRKIFTSKKSIVSLTLNPNKKLLAYISFEKIFPKIIVHDIISNRRIILNQVKGKINSIKWDKTGNNLLISMREKSKYYNLYTLNIKNNSIKQLTNYKYDVINPQYVTDNSLIYTSIIDKYPSIHIANLSTRKSSKLSISNKFLYASNMSINGKEGIAIVKKEGTYSLILLNDYKKTQYKTLFSNQSLESPKFIGKKSHLALTFESKGSNNIAIIDFQGNVNKILKFKNIKITELEVR